MGDGNWKSMGKYIEDPLCGRKGEVPWYHRHFAGCDGPQAGRDRTRNASGQLKHRSALPRSCQQGVGSIHLFSLTRSSRSIAAHKRICGTACQAIVGRSTGNGRHYLISIADSVRQMGKLIDDLPAFPGPVVWRCADRILI